jgi:hypothetical protein
MLCCRVFVHLHQCALNISERLLLCAQGNVSDAPACANQTIGKTEAEWAAAPLTAWDNPVLNTNKPTYR